MIDRATVYGEDAAGRHTVILRSGLPCRLSAPAAGTVDLGIDRAEQARLRELRWPADVALSEESQLLIDGKRWNIQAGTSQKERDMDGAVMFQWCLLAEAR